MRDMIGFIIIVAITIPGFIFISKAISSFAEFSLSYYITEKIDLLYENWLSKNPIYHEYDCDDSQTKIDQNGGGSDEQEDIQQEQKREFLGKRIIRTGGLIGIYMLICNILIQWGSLKELIIGSFIGVCVSAFQGEVGDPKFIQKFAGGALVFPVLLIIIRNYIDTYRMGLWIFTLSGIQLYLTQWLGVLFYYLICRSKEYHKNLKNIFALWIFIIFVIFIL
jgi:hypothetical protein